MDDQELPDSLRIVLLGVRVTALTFLVPGWSLSALSVRVRFGLTLALTIGLAPLVVDESLRTGVGVLTELVSLSTLDWQRSIPSLLGAFATELAVGVVLGASAGLIVMAARQAGDLIGWQAGINPRGVIGQGGSSGSSAMGELYGWVALAIFLVADGPLSVVRALAASLVWIRPGDVMLWDAWHLWTEVLGARIGEALELALQLSAPVALGTGLAGVLLSLLNRATPDLGLLSMTFPVRTLVGALLLLGSLALTVTSLESTWVDWADAPPWLEIGGDDPVERIAAPEIENRRR